MEAGESLPAIVTHTFGKGRVVYLGAGIDAAYYLYSYPYQRILLQQAIEWAASAPSPISVQAPMCVHAVTMRQQRDGERLVIHLYNDLNTTAFHAKPDEDVPLREEVVPIHDIRITLRGYNIQKAHLEPEGREVEVKTTPEGSELLVPQLDVHTMVVVDLK